MYSDQDKEIMKLANEARLPGRNRVEEIMNFARMAGYKKIGISNCIAFIKEAEQLHELLSKEFKVYRADCKLGDLLNKDVFENDAKGKSCNPIGQAEYLNDNGTQLNISMGLCMGHDLIFDKYSKAPVTHLIVKDREYQHRTMEYFTKSNE